MRWFFPLLALGCGESWTWDAEAELGDTGGGADSGTALHDLDGDGFTDITAGGDDCWDDPSSIPAGFEAISGTAQPNAAEVHPDATETWYDGVDQDCAGDDDFDQDGDTHRSATHADGAGAIGDDCYDAIDDAYPSGAASCAREGDLAPADVYPGATDAAYDGTDADCSGNDDFDRDGDGFGSCNECDDTNASIYPNDEPDVWYDGVDANCDGNDGDQDADGYCLAGYTGVACTLGNGDCGDTDASTFPGAADAWYDGVDSNCLGDDDFDQDGDGAVPTAYGGDDCDDTDNTVYIGAPDAWYDGVDSDCAGNDDFDQDFDGYDSTDDCDDTNTNVNPAATEDCATAYDDDCDGDDNDADAAGCVTYYEDGDGDGYGWAEACLCSAKAPYTIATGDDCDDADVDVSPAATEVCDNGVDDDCDGGAGSCGLTGGSLSGADAIWTGEAANDKAGISVSGAGDINGDGYDDVLVGAYTNFDGGDYAGAAYVMLGGASPSSSGLSTAVEYVGNVGESAGVSVSGAGDVDGDGLADVIIGAHQNSDAASAAGAAYLVLGSATPASSSLASATQYTGVATNDTAGVCVGGAGDVNGDGFSDVLVGARSNSNIGGTGAGAGYVVLGSASPASASLSGAPSYTGESAYDAAGTSVSAAGDVNGDGLDDVLIGAHGNAGGGGSYVGAAYLVLGNSAPSSASLALAVRYTGEGTNDYAGEAVSAAGDVDGDGYDDMLVGAPYNDDGGSDAGAAYLVLGSGSPASTSLSTAVQYTGVDTSNYAGGSVSTAGDVDGDGYGDLLVGAYFAADAGTSSGAAYIVFGSTTPASASLSASVVYSGEAANDFAGISTSGAGDVDGDGHLDILVGAFSNDNAATNAGAAYLILGTGL